MTRIDADDKPQSNESADYKELGHSVPASRAKLTTPDTEEKLLLGQFVETNWIAGAALALFVMNASLITIGYNRHWVLLPGYSSTQLAAAGGWVSGIGSLAAVIVAVRSARRAERETWQARKDAEIAA